MKTPNAIRNKEGYITNADELTFADVVKQKVLYPACGHPLEMWPFGFDEHAAKRCAGLKQTDTEKRKAELRPSP